MPPSSPRMLPCPCAAQVYTATGQGDAAANNSNYLARKKADLAARLAAAEEDPAQHNAVLAWSL
jgi:hypothetical protein